MIWNINKLRKSLPTSSTEAIVTYKSYHCFLVITALLFSVNLMSQTTTQGNTAGSPAFLGWDVGQNFPLNIQHQGPKSIIFSYNGQMRLSINPFGGIGLRALNNTGNIVRADLFEDRQRGIQVGIDNTFLGPVAFGGWFSSDGSSKEDYALSGTAVDGNGLVNVGVNARAIGGSDNNVGLIAELCQGSSGFAAFFNGDVLITGILDGPSDASLKTEVESLGLTHVNNLNELKTYSYNYNQDIEGLSLPAGNMKGVLAQEVTEVFPSIIETTFVPRRYDEEGELLTDTMSHLNVNYLQFIALAVNTYQHQDSLILDNANKLNVLKNRLRNIEIPANGKSNAASRESALPVNGLKMLNLYPNPVADVMVIEFEVDDSVEILILKVVDPTGKVVIEEREYPVAGLQNVTLPTSQLKAGIYELQLRANNVRETRKFVKK